MNEELFDQILTAIIKGVLEDESLAEEEWVGYGLVAEVLDDQSTIQAAYHYDEQGVAWPAPAVRPSFSLVELRHVSRDADGKAWDVMVLKIDRSTGEVATRFLSGADAAAYPTDILQDELLQTALRPRPEDFEDPTG